MPTIRRTLIPRRRGSEADDSGTTPAMPGEVGKPGGDAGEARASGEVAEASGSEPSAGTGCQLRSMGSMSRSFRSNDPGVGIVSTSGSTADLGLTYWFYTQANCSTCKLNVGFIESTDGGAHWGTAVNVNGPFNNSWYPLTTQGYMPGDYSSLSYVSAGGWLTVFAGSDNIRDAWSPYGNGDMLERAMLIGWRSGLDIRICSCRIPRSGSRSAPASWGTCKAPTTGWIMGGRIKVD